MKVYELSKKLGTNNKTLITFFKDNDFKVASHNQNLTDEQVTFAKKNFNAKKYEEPVEEIEEEFEEEKIVEKENIPVREIKKFNLDDMIECRSVVPWKMVEVGVDRISTFTWEGFGDIEIVPYRDLQSWRRKEILTAPKIIILDPDLNEQWKFDLSSTYRKFLSVDYPEEFFDVDDSKFRAMLSKAPDVFKEVIKYTAMNMIHNENYPSIQKINIIDEVLGTCIKEFI